MYVGKNKQNKTTSELKNEAVKRAEKKLQERIKELSAIYRTTKSITSSIDIKEIMMLILNSTFQIIKPDGSLIFIYKPSRSSFILKSYKGIDEESELKKYLISGKDYLFKQREVLNTKRTCITNDLSVLEEKIQFKLKKLNIESFVNIPLMRDGKIIGLFVNFSKTSNFFDKDEIRIMKIFSKQAAIAIQNTRLLEKTQLSYLNTVKALANIIEVKDSLTYGHSEKVMARTLAMADEMGLSETEKKVLRFASFLHDIGKIDIDVSILRKPSALSTKEWTEIKKHPIIGSDIVKGIGFLEELSPIILHHHERYSGGGYPDSDMKEEEIPLGARILAVADAYESMITDRPYRKALSKEEAIKELKENSGTQFDPKIIKILLKTLEK